MVLLLPLAVFGLVALALILLEVRTAPRAPRPERAREALASLAVPAVRAPRRRSRPAQPSDVAESSERRDEPPPPSLPVRAAGALGRDRRVAALIVAAVAALALGVVVVAATARGGGAPERTTAVTGPAAAQTIVTATGAQAATSVPTPLATAEADPGAPYSGVALLAALQSRGLRVTAATGAMSCASPGATVRLYEISRVSGDGAQRFALLVYPTAPAMQADWASAPGTPLRYRRGECLPGMALYWNQNLVLALAEVTDPGLRQQVVDAFLALGG